MLITNDAFLILSKLLVLSTKRWGTLLRCHTAHTTRLYKCHTQPVQLNKHSAKKKEELYVFKSNIDDNHPHSSGVILLSWAAGSFSLTSLLLFSSSRWQWEHHCCIQNSKHVVTSLAVTATLIEMFWCTMTFQKMSYCVWQLIQQQKSTHLTLNQNCIDVQLMSSHLIQCDT
jgi:hypothetical protein